MAATPDQMQRQLISLEAENRQLQAQCARLQETQASLEQIIGESNGKLLMAEMTSLELEQVFTACTDALWVVRQDGVVVRANEAMLQILGKSAAEVVGQRCRDLLDYHLCTDGNCPLSRLAGNTRHEYDIQLNRTDLAAEHYILSTAPLTTLDGSPGFVGQFKNITFRKKAEEELAAANIALVRMARIDGLTQIANRRCFDETLLQEWHRLCRTHKPLSLLLGDIDFFKKFNDCYGHQAGDDCLRRVAQALAGAAKRPADLAARYGGEEFVVLLPEVDLAGAMHVGRRILQEIGKLAIEHRPSTVSDTVTMSIGAASLVPSPAGNCEHLTKLADDALYEAKNGGRNRVVPNRAETEGERPEPLPPLPAAG